MKKLLLLALIFLPSLTLAITGGSHREDWSLGNPAVVNNQTSTCNNTATIRYDWVEGIPRGVIDSTATCTTVTASTAKPESIIWFTD